jgi:hypothetical protein
MMRSRSVCFRNGADFLVLEPMWQSEPINRDEVDLCRSQVWLIIGKKG